ncbi:histidine phosphatase family protein [Caballeronia sp. LZ019]|uniref:histidine phosphatase family protein n=1 Tax=Caballeronia sp. LZ019 TaxID=3038555 RepID=UPI0028641CFF|nr:histidine phosphatase family protein [Caballeronia sp. LZ019]MDR5807849.1 histidine phosphatase family protein [Caballeronia sp. LZ019]
MNVILLCHAATHAMKAARFPTGDEPAEHDQLMHLQFPRGYPVMSSPAAAARQTAAWITSQFTTDPAFDDIDYGRWRGHAVREIAQQEPENVAAWLSDVNARSHGGESIAVLAERVGQALERIANDASHECCVVVTHAIVVKAALALVRGEPLASLLKMDLTPLSSIWLDYDAAQGTWSTRNFDASVRLKRIDSA